MIEQLAEKIIRKKVSQGNFDFSRHALERMAEREIEYDKVIDCIIDGKAIDFQNNKGAGDIKVLFQEATDKEPEIYTVVAASETPVIITVCRTDKEVWKCIDNVLMRREEV